MATVGTIQVNVLANTGRFHSQMNRAGKSVTTFSQRAKGVGTNLAAMRAGVVGLSAALAGGVVGGMVTLAAKAETTKVRFQTLLGSTQNATKALADLRTFAAKTPFQFDDLAQGAAKLLSFGVNVENLQSRVKVLGDIAAGSGSNFNELASIFGKMKSSGVVALGDLNQLGDRGIPIMETLKKQLGLSGAELRKFVSTGQLGFQDVLAAMQTMTGKGGMFFGAMEKQSKTLSGSWSTLMDNLTALGTALGEILVPVLTPIVNKITEMVQGVQWLIAQAGLAEKKVPKTFEKTKQSAAKAVTPIQKVAEEITKLQESAKQVEMEFRSPDQVFKDRIGELNKMVLKGGLSWQTYDKAVARASRNLSEAIDKQDQLNRTRGGQVGALFRGSSAAFSAIQKDDRVQRDQLNEQREQTRHLERLVEIQEDANILSVDDLVQINEVSLP